LGRHSILDGKKSTGLIGNYSLADESTVCFAALLSGGVDAGQNMTVESVSVTRRQQILHGIKPYG
jgi:hypothetical protein